MLFLFLLACGGPADPPEPPAPTPPTQAPPVIPELNVGVPAVAEQKNPFSVQVEEQDMTPGESGVGRLVLKVPQGTYLYRDTVKITVLGAGEMDVGDADLPPGVMRFDEAFGRDREVWELDAVVELPLTAPKSPGDHEVLLSVQYQGCKGGLCFMPQTEEHALVVHVGEDA